MESLVRPKKTGSGWLKTLPVALLLLSGHRATAQMDTFTVGSGVPAGNNNPLDNYTPFIDATNFFNDTSSVFSWNLGDDLNSSFLNSLYDGWFYTLNFTNNGEMDSSTGFRFDTQIPNMPGHTEAASFYNVGNILCGTIDEIIIINQFGAVSSGGGIYVNATNIYDSGTISVAADGLAKFVGDNITFDRGTVAVENPQFIVNGNGLIQNASANFNISATGAADTGTNKWSPSGSLTPIAAFGPMNKNPFGLSLFGSVPYFNILTNGGTNVVVRMVFLQDNSVNVSNNVYINVDQSNTPFFNQGAATIEWVGNYTDPVTGEAETHYLYLNDDYDQGSGTNILQFGDPGSGVPNNYTFLAQDTSLGLTPPTASGFVTDLLNPGPVSTNIYSYVNAQFTATTVNPSAAVALTNLPGRVEISAAKSLNLSLASVSGMNYLRLESTNEFDTDGQSQFGSPYSDIYLGHTNGTFDAVNVVQSSLPIWNGSVQAWNTRWFFTDTNSGLNYDFRVLLVASQLNPVTSSSVQDFVLYSSNNVIISDALNITRTLSLNCTNLLLTTNGVGNGYASIDGELNLDSASIAWATAVPNLLTLTNAGTITYLNSALFIGQSNALSVIPGTNAVAASGKLSETPGRTGLNVAVNNKVVIGTNTYTFVKTLANKTPNQVKIGGKFDGSMSNLIAAINHSSGAGTLYSTNTHANPLVMANGLTNHAFTVTAILPGLAGNSIATTTTAALNLTWNGHAKLFGGVNGVAAVTNSSMVSVPYHNFYNSGLISGLGATVSADDFENYGSFLAGTGLFSLKSQTTTMSNAVVAANGIFSATADSMIIAGTEIQAGQSLTLIVTNLLSDTGVTNGNIWTLGASYPGYGSWIGLTLPIKPVVGDLLGTTITDVAVTNTLINNLWAAEDRGAINAGFSNNAAIGQLVLDAQGTAPHTQFYFSGPGASNAIYVDNLVLLDQATNLDGSFNLTALRTNAHFHIYYADATLNGVTVAEKLNHKNGGLLRWVPTYTGYFSSTNLVYPAGVTNVLNAALAQSSDIDSDGDGNPNSSDPTPLFLPADVNLTITPTNVPPLSIQLQWTTVAGGTNYVYYSTNNMPPWLLLTNFFSPFPYPSAPGTVSVFDPVSATTRYYQVVVQPNLLRGDPNP